MKHKESRTDWFGADCKTALKEKEKAYKKYIHIPTRTKWNRYSELRRITSKMCRRKKWAQCNKQLLDMEVEFKYNNSRSAYRYVKNLRERYKPRTDFCKDKNEQILGERSEIRATSYFEELLNSNQGRIENGRYIPPECMEDKEVPLSTLDEVKLTNRELKNSKAQE